MATQNSIIVMFNITLVFVLLVLDKAVPQELWYLVAGLAGLSVSRPGDLSPSELARTLEQSQDSISD